MSPDECLEWARCGQGARNRSSDGAALHALTANDVCGPVALIPSPSTRGAGSGRSTRRPRMEDAAKSGRCGNCGFPVTGFIAFPREAPVASGEGGFFGLCSAAGDEPEACGVWRVSSISGNHALGTSARGRTGSRTYRGLREAAEGRERRFSTGCRRVGGQVATAIPKDMLAFIQSRKPLWSVAAALAQLHRPSGAAPVVRR